MSRCPSDHSYSVAIRWDLAESVNSTLAAVGLPKATVQFSAVFHLFLFMGDAVQRSVVGEYEVLVSSLEHPLNQAQLMRLTAHQVDYPNFYWKRVAWTWPKSELLCDEPEHLSRKPKKLSRPHFVTHTNELVNRDTIRPWFTEKHFPKGLGPFA